MIDVICIVVASVCSIAAIAVVVSAFLDRRKQIVGEPPLFFVSGDSENMPQWDLEELQKHYEKQGFRISFGGSGSAHHVEECWAEERVGPISGVLLGRVNFDWHGTRGYWVLTLADAQRHVARLNYEAGFRGTPGSNAKL